MNKKTKVKKSKENIELSIGEDITKYDIMKVIAKKYSIYGSTVWLNTPLEEHNEKTPAQLMIDGELNLVYDLIQKSNGKFNL